MTTSTETPAHSSPSASHSTRGIVLVLLASTLWGTTGTAQSLGAGGLSPFWVGAAQLAVASAFFAMLLGLRRVLPGGASAASQGLAARASAGASRLQPRLLALASAGIAGYSICFYAGVQLTGVGVGTAVAIGSGPIWAGLIQAVLLRAPLTGLWWVGTAISVAGGMMMVLSKGTGAAPSAAGLGLCLLAGLSYASYALVNKRLVSQAPTGWVNFCVFTGAALLALPVAALLAGMPQWTLPSLAVVVYLGVVVSGLAYVAFSSGLRHIAGATSVTLTLVEPVAAFVLAVAIVGERQPLASWSGLGLVLLGLLVVIRAELRK
ncbi:MAG: DMT family transporter [Comamonadaceae bacterium]|nr:MAG: DMT family transporter [Comamonadaceae bacterium]